MEKQSVPPAPRYKHYLKLLLKLILTGLALYLVYRQVDVAQLSKILGQAKWAWLIPAFVLFVVSKLFNALRLQSFFSCIGLKLDTLYNIKLYLVGMFYNLFLPGGVGGDGYKVVLLRKAEGVRTRDLITATLLDRISGLAAIGFLALSAAVFSQLYDAFAGFHWVFWLGIVLAFPLYALAIYWIFPQFRSFILGSILYSLLVQIFVMGTVIAILYALNVEAFFIEYYTLFMVAAIAAALPFTVGGIGAREAVLVYLPNLIAVSISKDTAVALSLLFLAITVLTSFLGVFFSMKEPVLQEQNKLGKA